MTELYPKCRRCGTVHGIFHTCPDAAGFAHSGCSPTRQCHQWRICPACAARRQSKVADAAERLAKRVGDLRWTIIHPHEGDEKGAKNSKNAWLRAARPDAAIWTVEQSKSIGTLHINILSSAELDYHPAKTHTSSIVIAGDPRHVGAYISKMRQAPSKESFSGNTFGRAGTMREWLSDERANPLVRAAQLQRELNGGTLYKAQEEEWRKPIKAIPRTQAEYREIASRWLPDILEWQRSLKDENL